MFFNRNKYPFETKIRHHVSAYNYLPKSVLQNIPDNYPPLYDKIDWSELFLSGDAPQMMDIGCGKGLFLLQYAYENPEINCLGIEVREYPVEWIKNVAECEGLKNCNALRYSVANGLDFIENESINDIFYLFPDPWPKRKHEKRRAFNLLFINEVYNKLKPGANLWLATDVEEVREYQLQILNDFGKLDVVKLNSRDEWNFPFTNKENFCIEKNIDVYRYKCTK